MKLWVDDVRPSPEGYIWVKSVNEAISWIKVSDRYVAQASRMAHERFLDRDYMSRDECFDRVNRWNIELIDMDHDAGDYAKDGGDYIRLLDWLEETGRNYPIRIHSMNPVGVQNMRAIILKNGWVEVF